MKFHPGNCFKHVGKLSTVKKVLQSSSPTVATLARQHGRDTILIYLELWILDLNESTNVKTKMTPAQMQMTAEAIFDTYSLKISDLAYFFNQVKNGVYGSFYENLSREKIMNWLAIYYNDRCEVAQTVTIKNHDNFSATKDKMHPDVIKAMFKDTGKEKVIHYHEKNGVGSRNRALYHAELSSEIISYSTKKIQQFISELKKGVSGYCNIEHYSILKNEIEKRSN